MSDTVIRVENISKLYRLGEVGTGSLAHDVNRWWHRVRGKEDPYLKIGEVNDRTKSVSSVQRPESSAKNANALAPQPSSLDSSAPSLDSTPSSSSRPLDPGLSTPSSAALDSSAPSLDSTLSSSSRPLDPGLSTPSSAALDSRPSTLVSAPKAQAPSDWVYALRDVSFELRRGECLGLIGHNGAGKTTLLKMLNGLIKPDAGSITMRGRVGAHFCSTLGSGRSTPLPINGSVLGLTKKEPERRPPAGRVLRLGEAARRTGAAGRRPAGLRGS